MAEMSNEEAARIVEEYNRDQVYFLTGYTSLTHSLAMSAAALRRLDELEQERDELRASLLMAKQLIEYISKYPIDSEDSHTIGELYGTEDELSLIRKALALSGDMQMPPEEP